MKRDSENPLRKGTTMDSLVNTAAKRGYRDGLLDALEAVRGNEIVEGTTNVTWMTGYAQRGEEDADAIERLLQGKKKR